MARDSSVINISVNYTLHGSKELLTETDRALLDQAHDAALRAYAPYSKFLVGAALRMADGKIITGNNQENAAFPAGICAERTALHSAMSQWPEGVILEMAIMVPQLEGEMPVSPCGICRQALFEQEMRQGASLRLVLGLLHGPVIELESAGSLLPLSFGASFI